MPKRPQNTTNSPELLDSAVDVFGEILEAIHLRTAIFGKIDLGTPWHLRLPERAYLTFYVVARGSHLFGLAFLTKDIPTPLTPGPGMGPAVVGTLPSVGRANVALKLKPDQFGDW